jgi:formylglycine-generating enzyme
MKVLITSLLCMIMIVSCNLKTPKETTLRASDQPKGMKWIAGGEFVMGTDELNAYDHERPAHKVKVTGFWMDETEVTNEQFKRFADATGYITVAERKPDWEELKKQLPPGTPKPHDSVLVAGSLKFTPPPQPVMLNDYSQWWSWSPGTNWRNPEGKGSTLDGKWSHPVVHIAYEDALAYCRWTGKRLPTEAEWEFASRGGMPSEPFDPTRDLAPQGRFVANVFQGSFPNKDLAQDGFTSTSPVKTFPPNRYGLYDMIGNVWEWTADLYNVHYFEELARSNAITENPKGPFTSYDPNEPSVTKYVTKGGSYLCADDYCSNYRPSARQASAFDSGQSHIGFRCVK